MDSTYGYTGLHTRLVGIVSLDSTYGYTGLHTRLVGIVSLDSTYEYTGLHTRLVGTICTVRKKAQLDKSFVHFHLSQEI